MAILKANGEDAWPSYVGLGYSWDDVSWASSNSTCKILNIKNNSTNTTTYVPFSTTKTGIDSDWTWANDDDDPFKFKKDGKTYMPLRKKQKITVSYKIIDYWDPSSSSDHCDFIIHGAQFVYTPSDTYCIRITPEATRYIEISRELSVFGFLVPSESYTFYTFPGCKLSTTIDKDLNNGEVDHMFSKDFKHTAHDTTKDYYVHVYKKPQNVVCYAQYSHDWWHSGSVTVADANVLSRHCLTGSPALHHPMAIGMTFINRDYTGQYKWDNWNQGDDKITNKVSADGCTSGSFVKSVQITFSKTYTYKTVKHTERKQRPKPGSTTGEMEWYDEITYPAEIDEGSSTSTNTFSITLD